ncbi:hypothetical protein QJS10_CPB18g01269 [Acorus calamus]|uniref:Uncharacterized protein n=1 Tax=Acorus calamus TaxID=4465 RepID=A0AAV9CNF6_ACOCL|nr:hypothetical protein QJS10_CPB18g01269 [Acorus calamus]
MITYDEHVREPTFASVSQEPESKNRDLQNIILHLEEYQQGIFYKIIHLSKEKEDIEKQRDTAQASLSCIESQTLSLKQKFESDVQELMGKLDLSNAYVEKLQLELQEVSHKLQISMEDEKKCSERNRELSSKLMIFEIELEQITSEKGEFDPKLKKYESIERELERTKMSLLESQQENRTLMNSTQAADETVLQLQNELHCVKESLRCMHDELQMEKGLTEKLGIKVMDLSSQLNEKQEQLLSLDELKTEMSDFVQCVSDLEVEKSRLLHLLSQKEKSQEKADDGMLLLQYQVADQETQLTVLQEYFLAADVELVFTKSQFQIRMHELVDQVEAMESYNQELSLKHLEVTDMVNSHKYKEAHYLEENERLSTALQCLRSEFEAVVYKTEDLTGFLDQRSKMLAEIEKLKLNLFQCTCGKASA